MYQCPYCGYEFEENPGFCPNCGVAFAQPEQENYDENYYEVNYDDLSFIEKIKYKLTNTADYSCYFDQTDIEENKEFAAFCYLSIFVFIPLFIKKDSSYCLFHINQGLLLLIFDILYVVVSFILALLHLGILAGILFLIPLTFTIIGAMNALGGKAKDLPYFGHIRILK